MSRITGRDGPCTATGTWRNGGGVTATGAGAAHVRAWGAAACWNCDANAPDIVPMIVHAPAGGHTTLRLCRACWTSHALPLDCVAWELRLVPTRAGG